jgi:RND family efflux transporter MFP subunit
MYHRKHRAASTLMLVLFSTACGGSADDVDPEPQPVQVRVAPVTEEVITRPIDATGTVAPADEAALSFKTGGVIERIAVEAGARVRRGQLLATLDMREIDATLAKATSAAEKAERDLERARRLQADSVFTLAQFQDAETAAQLARADLETARFNRRYSEIIAPAEGAILSRSAEPGEMVSPGTPILSFGGTSRGMVVRAGLADRDFVRVRIGDPATVRFDALPGRTFEGTVREVGGSADAQTGTYVVEVALDSAAGLVSGMIGRLEIRPDRGERAALIPIEAVLEANRGSATVFALSADSSHAERRTVAVAFIDGDRVVVTSGLEGVSAVLTDGATWLEDGVAVRVRQ